MEGGEGLGEVELTWRGAGGSEGKRRAQAWACLGEAVAEPEPQLYLQLGQGSHSVCVLDDLHICMCAL